MQVKVYSTRICPYCAHAKQLLSQKGVAYTEIMIDTDPAAREEMQTLSQRRSVPQIFIGDRHIGGYDELRALDVRGELDTLLQD